MKRYCRERIAGQDDAWRRVIALARYYAFNGRTDELTYLITLTGTRGVLESQRERLKELAGEAAAQTVCRPTLPAGTPQEDYPPYIAAYLERMRAALPETECRRVLAGNHHGLPNEAFSEQVEFYGKTQDIDALLRKRHADMLNEMRECCEQGRLWYEQRITPEVLAYIEAHQEIQAGVRNGNRVYITKIPYQPDAWLHEADPTRRRYLACHCPFVRASVPSGTQVPSLWCYCTGGFEKLAFDILFGRELEVELLESVLDGAPRCRFAITLPPEAVPQG